jgi:hypothetical protein
LATSHYLHPASRRRFVSDGPCMTGLSYGRSYDNVDEYMPLLFVKVLIRECEANQQRDHEYVNNLHKLPASYQCRTGRHFHSLTDGIFNDAFSTLGVRGGAVG